MLQNTTTIKQGRDLVTLVNTFTVAPDKQQAVVDSLARVTEQTMCFLPGFIGASVHESLDGKMIINYVQWENDADFQAMFHNSAVATHLREVQALAESILPVLYRVAYVGAIGAAVPQSTM